MIPGLDGVRNSFRTLQYRWGIEKSIPSPGVKDYYQHDQQEEAEDDDARIPPERLFYVHGHTFTTYWVKFDL